MQVALTRRLAGEALGTAFLLATVVGSGIMGERLAAGNVALALLVNAVATGAMLFVLITVFAPISSAHFNPAVTLVELMLRRLPPTVASAYIAVQVAAAVIGVFAAHQMFDMPLLQTSVRVRAGAAQLFAEGIATFGLIMTIVLAARARRGAVAAAVACYITAAYFFTASTSFANPAVTLARSFSDTFAGIRFVDSPAFIAAQLAGALAAAMVCRWLTRADPPGAVIAPPARGPEPVSRSGTPS